MIFLIYELNFNRNIHLYNAMVFYLFQATWFATDEFSVVQFNTDNIETFKQFYIMDYADGQRQDIYTKNQLYKHVFHVWKQVCFFSCVALVAQTGAFY